ncbi:MAG TPA: transglycosylase SLT domain-containing protein [Burkholderiales bacterium]|nr:transglycosylase SLT domain-containing protein [Burkholderiales bacterium]
MIFRRFLTIAAFVGCAGAGVASAKAPSADEAFLKAYDAYNAGDPIELAKVAPLATIPVLAPYLEYWRIELDLENTTGEDVRAFLAREAGSYLAARLRFDWLKELGRRGEWAEFERQLPLAADEDLELRCYAWQARLARGDEGAYAEARAIWREPRDLPDDCNALADQLLAAGRFSAEDVWERVRLLLANGAVSAARRLMPALPEPERLDDRQLVQAATAPKKLLASPPKSFARRAEREGVLFALERLSRSDPDAAAQVLQGSLGARLPEADRQYVWGRVAYDGARRLLPEADAWYRNTGDAPLSDEQLAWKARIALRTGDWQAVRDAIDPMSAAARRDPAWTYWYGRALGAQGHADGARAYYLRISTRPDFYGLLASEELGTIPLVPEPFVEATEGQVAAARRDPGLARALELFRLELRRAAVREWIYAVRGMDDPSLLAAAELARREGLFDRAINTADRTVRLHNFKLRYLAPFREQFGEQARALGLEEAWVLGLVRQESRFIADARSAAGARGLMQLMPATARWAAKKIGLRGFHISRVADVETNIALGTNYLRHVLDDLGHPVLAATGYNAGPRRAERWRDAAPLEGAIYVESIPFNETRDYVKKVMANTMFYSQLVEGRPASLKEWLGEIPARGTDELKDDTLP